MKSNFLLPNRFKPVGWIVFFIGFLLSVLCICLQDTDILQTKVFALFYNIGINDNNRRRIDYVFQREERR